MAGAPTPLLIHLHIPRNAGSTLGRLLRLKLGFWPPANLLHHAQTLGFYRLPGFEQRLAAIAAMSNSARQRVRLFEAHAGYGLHEQLPKPSIYLTMRASRLIVRSLCITTNVSTLVYQTT